MAKSSRNVLRPRRKDFRYFLIYRTRWSDNDQYSHVNNAVYYHLIDSIVNTYLAEQCGCLPTESTRPEPTNGQSTVKSSPIGLVVSSYCNFFAPLSFPEPVTLGLRVVSLGRSSVSYEVGFFSEPEESAKAVGGYTHVFVDRVKRRPVGEMSAGLRDGLRAILVEDLDSDGEAKSKL